jgi:putative membrane protein
MKNPSHLLIIMLIYSVLSACSGTKNAASSTTGTTSLSDQGAATENPNAPSSPTAMASNNVQNTLDTTAAQFPVNEKGELSTDAFLHLAALSGTKEIALGKLAQQKAQSAEVKSLAASLVADHTKADAELRAIASSLNLKINMSLDTLKPEQDYQAAEKQLTALSTDKFDRAYLATMLDDHRRAVALFQLGTASKDTALKAFAQKYLPVLRDHLGMVEKLTR